MVENKTMTKLNTVSKEGMTTEDIVISALCKSSSARQKYLSLVYAEDFFIIGYRKIFQALVRLRQTTDSISSEGLAELMGDKSDKLLVQVVFGTPMPEITDRCFRIADINQVVV